MLLTEKKAVIYLVLIFVIFCSLFLGIRSLKYGSMPAGEEAYFHLRIAKQVEAPSTVVDALMSREYTFNPYHLLLHYTPPQLQSIVQMILAFLTVLFLYLLLRKLGLDLEKRFYLISILIVSPAFIYMAMLSNPHVFAILLGVMAFYFYFNKNPVAKLFFALLLMALPLFGIIEAVISIVILFGLYFTSRQKSLLFLAAALLAIYLLNFNFAVNFALQENALQNSITDFGGIIGFGVFNILLAVIGFLLTWRYKKQHYVLYLIVALLFLSVKFLGTTTNIYLNFIFAYLASLGMAKLLNRSWDSDIIKYLTIFVLVSGFLFSGLSYLDRVANLGPDTDAVDSLSWLSKNSNPDSVVFSHPDKGFLIEYFANRKPVTDSYTTYENALDDTEVLFWSRNLETSKRVIARYGIDYIWIDREMISGQVWSKDEQGLLFLFKNKETFEKVYGTDNVQIWKVVAKDLN